MNNTCDTCLYWQQYNKRVKHGHCRHPQATPNARTQGTWSYSGSNCQLYRQVRCVLCKREFIRPMGHVCNGQYLWHINRHARQIGLKTIWETADDCRDNSDKESNV